MSDMLFIGDYPAKTDAKGRVFMPAAFRKVSEEAGEKCFVLRNDIYQHCLVLYPLSVWKAMLADMNAKLNTWNKDDMMLLRLFSMDVEMVELDANGRFLISKRKLEYAGISSEVRFVAVNDIIEVWGKEQFEAEMTKARELGNMVKDSSLVKQVATSTK